MQPALDPQPRGSFAVRYQNAVLRWALAGLLVLMLAYALGWWLQGQGWATAQFPATVLWCVIPYAMATQWLYQGAYLPHFERVSYVVVAATMPFALTPLGFALAQHPSWNNVHNNLRGVGLMLRALTERAWPDLHTLFSLHARARGTLVASSGAADTRFGLQAGEITPFELDRIRAEFL